MWKTINISQLDRRLFINANKKTVTTLPIFSQPLFEFSIDSDPSVLGKAVRKCLESWTEGHPQPDREALKHINDPLIELAGKKSPKDFFDKIKSIPTKLVDNTLSFYPTINNGWKEGFSVAEGGPVVIQDINKSTDFQIGNALINALSMSFDKPK